MKTIWKILLPLLFLLLAACAMVLSSRQSRTAPPEPTAPTAVPAVTETLPETQPETVPETQPPAVTFDSVPLYYQSDYPYIKYGNGTIATSGCSLTSLAMVATYLTDHEYLPDELVYHFGKYGKNNIERLEYAAEQLHLPYTKNFNWRETQAALAEGKVAIVMENERSPFTTLQHFIVLAGVTEEGRVIVNDPFKPNYYNEKLMDGFQNGFPEYAITSGYSGAWVFDKSTIPEDLELYDASKPELPETRYTGYELPEEDIYFLACFAWAQARNQSEQVQQAVLEVVLNRLVSGDFPDTVQDVIYGGMYETSKYMKWAQPTMPQYRAVSAAMYGPYVLPKDVLYYAPWQIDGDLWGQLEGYWFSYTPPDY